MSDIFKYVDKNNSTAELITDKNQIKQCHITDDFPKIPKFEKGGICGVKTPSVYSDFSEIDEMIKEHDKVFEDKIATLEENVGYYKDSLSRVEKNCDKLYHENKELKQRIAELESRETESFEKEPISDDYRPSMEWYENRHQSDCIEINRLNTTIDVLIHKVEYLRQFAGLE